jgi:hypothetical protein
MLSPYLVDKVCLALALIVPPIVIFRFGHRQISVLFGAIFVWGILFVSSLINPAREAAAMLDALWLYFGWAPAVFYALVLYWLRRGFVYFRERRNSAAQSKS